MQSHLISAWRSGLRSHNFHAVFTLGILLIGIAYLAGIFSPRQPETVTLDTGLSGIRFSLILLSLFWVQDLIGKEIERRTTILYLSYPTPRAHYLAGRFIAITLLLLIASLIFGLLLWITVMSSSEMFSQAHRGSLGAPFWLTIIGVWLNAVVVAAFALCIATISTISALPLTLGAAFAIAGQSLGAVADYLAEGAGGQPDLVAHYSVVINIAQWLLPDLSRLDWRVWTMYDLHPAPNSILLSSIMALSYIALMLSIAIQTFKHREFD